MFGSAVLLRRAIPVVVAARKAATKSVLHDRQRWVAGGSGKIKLSSHSHVAIWKVYGRQSSSLISALVREIEEEVDAGTQGSLESAKVLLQDSPFEPLSMGSGLNPEVVLKNGNAEVSFRPSAFEDSGEELSAVPMVVRIIHEGTQMAFGCVASYNDETKEGGLDVENIVVEPAGGIRSDDPTAEAFSPKIGELDEGLRDALFEYLEDHGVNSDFCKYVTMIAAQQEEDLYLRWLKDMKSFVEKEQE